MEQNNPETKTANERGDAEKQPYTAPTLVEYGSIAKLTSGTATVASDALVGPKNPQCL